MQENCARGVSAYRRVAAVLERYSCPPPAAATGLLVWSCVRTLRPLFLEWRPPKDRQTRGCIISDTALCNANHASPSSKHQPNRGFVIHFRSSSSFQKPSSYALAPLANFQKFLPALLTHDRPCRRVRCASLWLCSPCFQKTAPYMIAPHPCIAPLPLSPLPAMPKS